jgi:hypothetical protein
VDLRLCRCLVSFLCFSFALATAGPNNYFTGAAWPLPSLDFLLEDLDEGLESCFHRVSFVLPSHSYFHAIVIILNDCSISQALALSEKQRARRVAESVEVAKNVELEALVRSQAEKIAELKTPYADSKRDKDNVTTSHRRLTVKHDAFVERAEQEKCSLWRPTRRSWLSFVAIWISRPAAT